MVIIAAGVTYRHLIDRDQRRCLNIVWCTAQPSVQRIPQAHMQVGIEVEKQGVRGAWEPPDWTDEVWDASRLKKLRKRLSQ